MSQVSRYHIHPIVEEKIGNLFEDFLKTVGKFPKVTPFIVDLFTPTEKVMLAKRIAIAFLLYQGKTDIRGISRVLKVSTSTVNNVNTTFKISGDGYKTIFSRMEKVEKVKDVLNELAFYMISGSERQAADKFLGKLKPPKRNRYLK